MNGELKRLNEGLQTSFQCHSQHMPRQCNSSFLIRLRISATDLPNGDTIFVNTLLPTAALPCA